MSASLSRCNRKTKKILTFSLTLSMLFSLFSVTSLKAVQATSEDVNYSIKSTVTFANPNESTKTWNLTEEDRTVSLFMNNSWQNAQLEGSSHPFEALRDDDGNNIAVLKFPKQQVFPGENASYTVEYRIVSKPRAIPNISVEESDTLDTIPSDLKDNYTRAEGPWLVKDPALVSLAHEIVGKDTNVLRIIKGFIGWIKNNITYTTHEYPLYPNETLSAREGDCDDQAILLITLSRIMGIPSYLQLGAIYMPEQGVVEEPYWDNHARVVERKIGWHGWAIVYVPPWGWLPIDLTYVLGDIVKDPLNAIRYGAVVWQKTVQYMNFSKVDYVAESREARDFIIQNGFFIESEDEMTEIAHAGLPWRLDPSVPIVLATVIVMLAVGSLLIAHRWRKNPKKAKAPSAGS